MLDTIFWLLNFPASNGYAMVFIAAFGSTGLAMLAFGGARGNRSRLQALREQEGLAAPTASAGPAVLTRTRQIVFRIVFAVVLGSGAVGLLALIGVPVTNAYIHANGVETTGTMDSGDWVTFTTEDGAEYTLANDFFTPSVYPDAHASVGWDDAPVTVRYLPGHPQAFVIDSTPASGD